MPPQDQVFVFLDAAQSELLDMMQIAGAADTLVAISRSDSTNGDQEVRQDFFSMYEASRFRQDDVAVVRVDHSAYVSSATSHPAPAPLLLPAEIVFYRAPTTAGSQAPPNSPANSISGFPVGETRRSRGRPKYNILDREVMAAPDSETRLAPETVTIDFRALHYVNLVDENLICPICRVALFNPVDTDCGHTFCKDCITEALIHNPSCPVDRIPMTVAAALPPSNKIIRNQLDALQAACPMCEESVPRSMLLSHVDRYCPDAPVHCASSNCQEFVRRKLVDNGCLHFPVTCPDCHGEMQELNLEGHREKFCEERVKDCEHCGITIKRFNEEEHLEVCAHVKIPCCWADYGCVQILKRKDLQDHKEECFFKNVGPMADALRKEISDLRLELKDLMDKNTRHERRIKFLEGGENNVFRAQDVTELANSSAGPSDASTADPLDTPHDYVLNLLEAQQNRMGQFSASMTELDARQSMLIFNEAMSRQTEIAELRSAQQVISMHVRWLMNFRRQENQRRGYTGTVGGTAQPSGSGAELPLPRRLSDSATRDLTKL